MLFTLYWIQFMVSIVKRFLKIKYKMGIDG